MRILVGTDQWSPDYRGGSARVAADTSRALAERGHDVVVLAPRARGLPAEERDGTLVVRRLLHRSALPVTLTDVAAAAHHGRRLRRAGFDLVLSHSTTTSTGLLAARTGAPHVFVYHAPTPREVRFDLTRLPLGRRKLASYALLPPLELFERIAVARASRILVLSRFSGTLLLADHPTAAARMRLVRAGVGITAFTPGDGSARSRLGVDGHARLLVTARRLEPRMGLEELLRAVATLRARGMPVELAIAGKGLLRDALERLRDDLGLGGAVRLLGRVPDEELVDWYRAADLFVLPTLAYEGFGVVTAEALACGTPVVGTPVGATPELLGPLDERLLATGTGVDDLADAVARGLALVSPELRRRCRAYAEERFSWIDAIESWEHALEEATAEVPARSARR